MENKVEEEIEKQKVLMDEWVKLGEKILNFPKWLQDIMLEDINSTIANRVATMNMILKSMKKPE